MSALDVGILIVVAAMLVVVGAAWWSGRRRSSYEEYMALKADNEARQRRVDEAIAKGTRIVPPRR